MTSRIDELEALLAALRLSFLTSSSATSSPEALCQSIAAFRAALSPQSIVVASPSPTVAHIQKQDDRNHRDFVTAGEPTSATSTTCGDDDRIDMVSQLAKRIDLVDAELRQGNDHIRELVQSVEDLKKEVRDLRSAVVAPKSLANTEDHPPPSPPVIDAVEKCTTLTPVNQAQVEPSPSPYAVGGSRFTPWIPTCPQPIPEVTTSSSIPSSIIPSSIIPARSFIPPKLPSPRVAPQLVSGATPMTSAHNPHATEATELPTLPPLWSWLPSLAPFPVAIPTPAQTLNTVSLNPPDSPSPPSPVPVPVDTQKTIPVLPESPKPALSDIEPKDCTDQTVPRLTGEKGATRRDECEVHAPNDEGKTKAEDTGGLEDSVAAESRPKSPVIATANRYFCPSQGGDLLLKRGDKIRILDNATTPVGWMYGEVVETRRGIFPARCVREKSCLDAEAEDEDEDDNEDELNSDHIYDNSEKVEPDSKSPVIVTAVQNYDSVVTPEDELTFSVGDTIKVLDSPDTPVGWMYGEIVKTRRGFFPARFVTLE